MSSKTIINGVTVLYHGMMLNNTIGMDESGNMEGWLWAQHPDGQWVSLCEIPNYKAMKAEIAKYKKYINELEESNSKIKCAYCNTIYSNEQKQELVNHIMTCESSPLVQCIKARGEAIDLLIKNIESLIANMGPEILANQKADAVIEATEALLLIRNCMDYPESLSAETSNPDGEE